MNTPAFTEFECLVDEADSTVTFLDSKHERRVTLTARDAYHAQVLACALRSGVASALIESFDEFKKARNRKLLRAAADRSRK